MVDQPRLWGVSRATIENCPCTGDASYYTVELRAVQSPATNQTGTCRNRRPNARWLPFGDADDPRGTGTRCGAVDHEWFRFDWG